MGVLFSYTINFNKSVNDLALRGKRALISIMSITHKTGTMSRNVFFKLFDTQIQPILLYGCEVWGFQRYDCLEKIHLLACKKFLRVGSSTPNCMVYGECGRYPLYISSQIRCLKHWLKLLNMHEKRIPKLAYNMLFHLDEMGKTTWASSIRYLLFSHGFGCVWLCQSVGDVNMFLREFRNRSVNMFHQNWHSTLFDSSRYQHYRLFKTLLQPELYLSVLTTDILRTCYIRFRLGLLDLAVNEGRKMSIDKSQRICPLCKTETETEIHFVFVCPLLDDIRRQYLPRHYVSKQPEHAFVSILTTKNESVILQLSLYLKHALSKRNELLKHQVYPVL